MSAITPLPRNVREEIITATAGQTMFGAPDWVIFDVLDVGVSLLAPDGMSYETLADDAFTVAPVSTLPGPFTLTLATGVAAGTAVRITGRRTDERLTNVTRGGAIKAVPLEAEMDRITVILQEMRRDLDRAIRVPELSAGELPVIRGSSIIGFTGDGTPTLFNPDIGLGNVIGPASVADKSLALFDGVTGKVLKAAALTAPALFLLGSLQAGTGNFLPKWSSGTLTQASQLFDNGTSVGIGTATPGARLDVNLPNARIGDGNTGDLYLRGGAGAGLGAVVSLLGQGVTHTIGQYGRIYGGIDPDLTIMAGGGAPIVVHAGDAERIRVDPVEGFVGINTPGRAPVEQLEVGGSIQLSTAAATMILSGGSGALHGALVNFTGQGVTHYIGNASRVLGGSSASLLDYVAGANDRIFALNNVERMRISGATGYVGIGTDVPNWLVSVAQASSAIPWTGLTTLWNVNRTVVGNYPLASQYGSNTVGTVEVLVGAVDIPAVTNSFLLNGWGVAGYARTASSQTAAVGIFGYGGMTATGAFGAWGGNVIVTNSPSHQSGTNSGYDALSMYGFEINPMLWKTAGGGGVNIPLRGLYIIGASELQTSNLANGIEIDAHGVFTSPKIPWKIGITTIDAAATTGISLGALAVGNNSGSQPLEFRARDAGGTQRLGTVSISPNGDFAISPATVNGVVALQDGVGGNVLLTHPTFVSIGPTTQATSTTTGALQVAGGAGFVKDVYIGGQLFLTGAACTPYASTISPGGGTGFTGAASVARFWSLGKLCWAELTIGVSAAGTGSGTVDATLPFTAAANSGNFHGRETSLNAKGLTGLVLSGTNVLHITYSADGSYPGATGAAMVISGWFERT